MTIKPKKVTSVLLVIGSGFILFSYIKFFMLSHALCACVVILSLFYWLPFLVATGRIFIFSEKGCEVRFLCFRKMYMWDELKMKQYVTYSNCHEYRSLVTEAAEFSPKKVRIPKWMQGYTYSHMFHPFSFVFVYFPPDPRPKDENRYPIEYEADKELFRAKLKEWGVEMEEVVRGK